MYWKFFCFLLTGRCRIDGAPAFAQSPDHANHKFSGAEHWAKVFDDPERDKWQKPHEVITALRLAPDQSVADIGAGTGYFAVRFAHMLPQGRVYAVDVEPDMVKYLGERAKKENLANLTAVAGTPDDARIPAPVDLVILVDVYHHIDQRADYFRKLRACAETRAGASRSSTFAWMRRRARRKTRASRPTSSRRK